MSKSNPTLADYAVSTINLLLIMVLVGSLLFFLVEVSYIGQYYGRILWFFFFYIFGSVLVACISTRPDIGSRAGFYGLVLGLLMWIALMYYVEFPRQTLAADLGWAIHLAFIFLISWSTNKLTRECISEEEQRTPSGAGLLDAAGLAGKKEADPEKEAEATKKKASARKKKKTRGLIDWWERYQQYREEKKHRPRTHGVWVVYFSLAALPLFGLGQALIPATDLGRRQYAFWLMCIYVASGLGLLLSTTFLGLRRYLGQRRLEMPAAITTTWLFAGTGLIGLLLILGALLLRPYPEYSITNRIFQVGSPQGESSEWAMKVQDPTRGKGTPGENSTEQKKQVGEKGKGKPNQSGEKGKGKGEKNNQNQKEQGDSKKNDSSTQPKENQKEPGNGQEENQQETTEGKTPSSFNPLAALNHSWGEWFSWLAGMLKWVVLGAVILLVLFFLLKTFLSFLANFTLWARNLLNWFQTLWAGLWTRGPVTQRQQPETISNEARHKPFTLYRDPFLSGTAGQMSPVELIRYSFEALQAWSRERHLPGLSGETPLEFIRRVSQEFPPLETDSHTLFRHYATAAYAPQLLSTELEGDLRQFWLKLEEVTERPLSAGTLSSSR